MPLKDLHDYEGNAKTHDRKNVEAIKESLTQFGMCDPIGVWHDGERHVIVEGHGRRTALEELGYDKAPCIVLNHLTDEQRRAYALAHNQTTLMSGFDYGILTDEITRLTTFDWGRFGLADFSVKVELPEIEELDEDTYEEPKHVMLRCPSCGHVDRKEHYMRATE